MGLGVRGHGLVGFLRALKEKAGGFWGKEALAVE